MTLLERIKEKIENGTDGSNTSRRGLYATRVKLPSFLQSAKDGNKVAAREVIEELIFIFDLYITVEQAFTEFTKVKAQMFKQNLEHSEEAKALGIPLSQGEGCVGLYSETLQEWLRAGTSSGTDYWKDCMVDMPTLKVDKHRFSPVGDEYALQRTSLKYETVIETAEEAMRLLEATASESENNIVEIKQFWELEDGVVIFNYATVDGERLSRRERRELTQGRFGTLGIPVPEPEDFNGGGTIMTLIKIDKSKEIVDGRSQEITAEYLHDGEGAKMFVKATYESGGTHTDRLDKPVGKRRIPATPKTFPETR